MKKIDKIRIKKVQNLNPYRGKYISVLVQPKILKEFWAETHTDKEIEIKLAESGYILHTELIDALNKLEVESIHGVRTKVSKWAFGTETSRTTNIPHFQIYLEFPKLIRRTSVYHVLNEFLEDRVHIVTKTVYHKEYKNYCLKETSNYNFYGNWYWNVKVDSEEVIQENRLVNLRPKLKMIRENYFIGQKLLQKIALGEPDDRTGIWLADVIGNTGKTAYFQSMIDENKKAGLYLRISEGLERLSSKLRKKITKRLEDGNGYPRFIWINFGRTIDENNLRTFADFGEQVLDGMLDDNFGNTGYGDFMPLPYVNLIITANTPPNLKQMTVDRMKLLTLFPIFKDGKIIDSILIPIFVEIRVRFVVGYPHNFSYKYIVRLLKDKNIEREFRQFEWYEELLENIKIYKEFLKTEDYNLQKEYSELESDWIPSNERQAQQDVLSVHQKALSVSASFRKPHELSYTIEASSFKEIPPIVHMKKKKFIPKQD